MSAQPARPVRGVRETSWGLRWLHWRFRGNHEQWGRHSVFTQLRGHSIPRGAHSSTVPPRRTPARAPRPAPLTPAASPHPAPKPPTHQLPHPSAAPAATASTAGRAAAARGVAAAARVPRVPPAATGGVAAVVAAVASVVAARGGPGVPGPPAVARVTGAVRRRRGTGGATSAPPAAAPGRAPAEHRRRARPTPAAPAPPGRPAPAAAPAGHPRDDDEQDEHSHQPDDERIHGATLFRSPEAAPRGRLVPSRAVRGAPEMPARGTGQSGVEELQSLGAGWPP